MINTNQFINAGLSDHNPLTPPTFIACSTLHRTAQSDRKRATYKSGINQVLHQQYSYFDFFNTYGTTLSNSIELSNDTTRKLN
jgi:predicted nucleotide-binding protein (sugar kinase/HSP70/actin superfamily)